MKVLYKIGLVIMMGILSLSTKAQDELPAKCSTPSREVFYESHPDAQVEADELEEMTRKFIKRKQSLSNQRIAADFNNPQYVVPVVFHVFGTDFAGKTVDDALVKDALLKTNEDFHGLNNDFNDVSNPFRSLRSTLDIKFRLAEVDPNGNPTTGINYYNVRTGFGRDYDKDDEIREFAWDNYKYMNVYILLDLKNDILNRSGVAWYPSKTDSDNGVARVVFNGRYLGTNSDENFRRILTHEFGHYLNLAHTFDGGCSGTGDNVDDTPATTSNAGSCIVTTEKCAGAGIPNSENFMDYTECYRMFTHGQVTRMQAALQHETRHPLWQTANHAEVFAQSPSGPKLFYDFTTFTENFENQGAMGTQRDVAIRLENGPTFSTIGTLSTSSYTVENLPAGLSMEVISSTTTAAVVRLTGAATSHASANSIRNLKLTFNNAAFTGFNASSILGSSRPDLRIEFKDPYISKYLTSDRLIQVGIDGDNFESFDVNPGQSRPRYEFSIDNERIMMGFDAGVKHIAVTANSEVALLAEGTTIGSNLNWNHDDRDQVLLNDTYQTWKGQRGFIGLRIEREGLPGLYYYGWARVDVSTDGKVLRFIDYYTHEDPDAVVKAGESDVPLMALSRPTLFEDQSNNGQVSETIDVILEGSASFTSQNLQEGTHFTVGNLPDGLTASIQKTNGQLAKLVLSGTATSHVRGDGALVELKFLDAAFTVEPGNKQEFDVQVRFFDPYKITYIDTQGLLPWINAQNNNQWVFIDTDFDFGDNFRYSISHYTSNADGNDYVTLNARGKGFTMDATTHHPENLQSGSQVSASSSFVSTAWGVNNGPLFAGPGVPWNGTNGYTGLRFRDRAGRLHYGWVRMEANASGTEARMLAIAYNTQPDAAITVGQTVDAPCYAGGILTDKIDDYSTSIGNFKFEHFSQKSDFPQNYTDFTSKEIKVRPGVNMFTAEAGGSLTSSKNILGMWIDLNNDNDFEDSGEQLHMSAPFDDGTNVSGEVTLPNVNGTYTLRVTVKNETEQDQAQPSPCDFFLHGEVEDYTINISPTNPLHPVADFEMPSTISAKGLATITDKSLKEPETWSWQFPGGSPATSSVQQPPGIYYENTGMYEVTLTVTKGGISNTLTKTLIVEAHPTAYCEVSRRGSYPSRGDITKVVLGDINNTTATGSTTGYSDFKSQSTTLTEGQTYPFEITTYRDITSTDAGTNLIIWMDWNRNNEFTLDEKVYERRSLENDPETMVISGNITVPTIYSAGASVMRVIRYYSFDSEDRPVCGEIAEADAEDYTINLVSSGAQPPVADFQANVTAVQEGGSVSFTDTSTGNPTSWSWTFTGGTPASSTDQNPVILYGAEGTYEVSLTATNAGGSHTETKTGYISVTTQTGPTYCESAGTRVQYEWIAGVQVGSFNNTSAGQLYSDFTAQTVEIKRGEGNVLTLTPGYSGSAYDEYFKVWIDYNKDGDFEDAGELAFDAGSASNAAVTGTITPAASVALGTTRMRVSMKYNAGPSSCGSVGDGEVEDYTANITGTTTPPVNYCESAGSRVQYEWIAGVQVGTFSHTSTGQLYSDFTGQTISLQSGVSHAITLTPGYSGTAYDEYFRVWIDYNKDGDFEDAGELVFDAGSASSAPVNGTITPATSVPTGTTRMRVSMKYNAAPSACGSVGDGEVEDYTVDITNNGSARNLVGDTERNAFSQNNLTTLYPNPASSTLNVQFNNLSIMDGTNVVITIYDVSGKIVQGLNSRVSMTSAQFDIEKLQTGAYFINIQNEHAVERKTFIKE
ncbi:MAG: GEVED domain-containing protein [Reichenbachiella sp.]|uniref:GEVED domain-containing protein n=3 Tax=Reichenbachiella sp. TaxID=2184521 RepID=UPI0032678F14